MNWTFDQLNAFVSAVKYGSFSAAARQLGKAQSRVSTAINNLEIDLGFTLFDRSTRTPTLTEKGQEMFVEALAVLEQCQRLDSRAQTVSAGQELALVLAIDEAVPINALGALFESVSTTFPLFKLTIINGSQDDIAQWVDEGKADFGILFYYLNDLPQTLEYQLLSQFTHALIVSVNHPLSSIEAPTITDLAAHRQLAICDRMGEIREKPLSPTHWHIDSYYQITELVIRTVGWAIVPEHVAHSEWYQGQIKILSTTNIAHPLLIEMGSVKRRDRGGGPIMQWIRAELVRIFQSNN
ncbi:LysR family transcriptional regulator [Colwellia ponticola]|uniref:LysR family transcriptional regulator n=1 Tax=Colwellia ponticola TaxID=2304625 RepID=A0A8H2JMJ6_9GAMM|nr:LysR family transcriptional regulator [Colwellia ponticola]TMM45976.1 LysR family transcriptional regulator [Colwellia ponticola]